MGKNKYKSPNRSERRKAKRDIEQKMSKVKLEDLTNSVMERLNEYTKEKRTLWNYLKPQGVRIELLWWIFWLIGLAGSVSNFFLNITLVSIIPVLLCSAVLTHKYLKFKAWQSR